MANPDTGSPAWQGMAMSEISVRALGEGDWELYRSVRLRALEESPDAFVASHDTEADQSEQFWTERMKRSQRLLAEVDGEAAGIASVGAVADRDDAAQIFGLWVDPALRGSGVATALVKAGVRRRPDRASRTWSTGSAPTTVVRSPSRPGSVSARPPIGVRCAWSARTTARKRSRWTSRSPTGSAMPRADSKPIFCVTQKMSVRGGRPGARATRWRHSR